jgi:hypothetical protein
MRKFRFPASSINDFIHSPVGFAAAGLPKGIPTGILCGKTCTIPGIFTNHTVVILGLCFSLRLDLGAADHEGDHD